MMLDLLQLTGNRFSIEGQDPLQAFEVGQYICLAEEIETLMTMGMSYDEAYPLALEVSEII